VFECIPLVSVHTGKNSKKNERGGELKSVRGQKVEGELGLRLTLRDRIKRDQGRAMQKKNWKPEAGMACESKK